MDASLALFFDQTVNGLVAGNIYALVAVGLAVTFGVANLINFAHGSVYMVGAYLGWWGTTRLGLPLPAALAGSALICAGLGVLIERVGLRGLARGGRVAPLLATIGISFMLDQLVQLVFSPDPQRFPNPLPVARIPIGGVGIGLTDLVIAGTGAGAALALALFLRYHRLGWALRATAGDREAAAQMGVDVHRVNQLAFALAGALGGVAGVLVGIYFQTVYPTMSFGAVLKGFAAALLGGLGSIPGALAGGLLLGLIESYGVAAFGSAARNLFAFGVLLAVLVFRPNGLFQPRRQPPPEPLTGAFVPSARPVQVPRPLIAAAIAGAALLPLALPDPVLLQALTNAWLLALLALSATLLTGAAGQIALGQAGFAAIGAYSSALLTLRVGLPFEAALFAGAGIAGVLGALLALPAFRLRAHYVAIATIGLGEIIAQVILNWRAVTNGALGLNRIPPPSLFGVERVQPAQVYWLALALLLLAALLQWRLLGSTLGRAWRMLREDDLAAQAFGVNLNRYKALAFFVAAGIAGLSGAFSAHMYSYINHQTFPAALSILALIAAILGGLGNITGAILGALILTLLPEALRGLAEYRYLFYGALLVALIRFRPGGLLGAG